MRKTRLVFFSILQLFMIYGSVGRHGKVKTHLIAIPNVFNIVDFLDMLEAEGEMQLWSIIGTARFSVRLV